MSDGQAFAAVFGVVIVIIAAFTALAHFSVDFGCSLTLLRAHRRRRRAVNERAAGLMDLGYTQVVALHLASAELEDEAAANVREIESVMR